MPANILQEQMPAFSNSQYCHFGVEIMICISCLVLHIDAEVLKNISAVL